MKEWKLKYNRGINEIYITAKEVNQQIEDFFEGKLIDVVDKKAYEDIQNNLKVALILIKTIIESNASGFWVSPEYESEVRSFMREAQKCL